MAELFIPPQGTNDFQLMFLTIVYGYVLYTASGLISDGSELLLLVPSIAGLVGSIVLPILGAVPDGVMMLFSGLGGGDDVQKEVSVGVGTLAGSTVMLLTIPWFIAVFFGGVPVVDGQAKYELKGNEVPKSQTGVSFQDSISKNAKIMLGTTLLYAIIQVPAIKYELDFPERPEGTHKQAAHEAFWSLVGCVCCLLAFVAYLVLCYIDANTDKVLAKIIEGISKKEISLMHAMAFVKDTSKSLQAGAKTGSSHELLLPDEHKKMQTILRPFFYRYDDSGDGTLDFNEFKFLMKDMGEDLDKRSLQTLFQKMDADKNGSINFEEFTECVFSYVKSEDKMTKISRRASIPSYDVEGEEEEEVPEDLAHLPAAVQRRRVLFRSTYTMGAGLILVLLFSDPMVDVFSEWGNRMHISGFYIAFVLAPMASNASELLAAYNYAMKKTTKSITTSLSTLVGAACMNNTFCLAIFFALIYFKEIAWQFTAETVSIVVIQWIIGILAIVKSTHTFKDGCMILACYPLCIGIVWFLENVVGLD
eukprot:TRINITY_DN19098_c0_g2_i1.p1 TRINITY_DN19098_c0_g2~~TRINITY_DN19098_c0_g2_i1.p1  ORF type:complete len:533 (+),score=128.72 TRINITY_DN19098_c0_g2_i1:87-1685(+)